MDTASTISQIPPVVHRPGRPETRRAAARASNGRHTRNRYYPGELDNDVAIARSDIPLPGEGNYRRQPSLERQEAFYDASTSKNNPGVRRRSFSEDAQVARLYQEGFLYNDGEAVGDTLELNSIRHDEPTYIVRPAKPARKNGKQGRRRGGQTYSLEPPLALDLSFSDIGDDEAIARYFSASQQAPPEDLIQHASSQDSVPPLRVIYELDGSQGTVDVDASQPPDLILDSEFDILSDSEMHDTPTSTQNSAADPSSAWVMVGDDL